MAGSLQMVKVPELDLKITMVLLPSGDGTIFF